ncbi:M23 family metallopeptidase [Paenibacillus sp. tmac-D7]|uniref:M23 family metallopeptidase n=1 Tax=Paenibacillus sp. tmac-D7 TaxID=2591462 RepID=UPI0015E86B6B|nr:M23 family metallopeptidase [Paenibacillus sp. tmac-D7]
MKNSTRLWKRTLGTIQWVTAFAVIVTVVLSGRWFIKAQTIPRYDVFLDEQLMGTVSDPDVVKRWKNERYEEMERQQPNLRVTSNMERLHFVGNETFHGVIDNEAVIAALKDRIVFYFFAAEIRIDGKSVGVVKDVAAAAELLEQIKAPFLPSPDGKNKRVRALSAEFVGSSPDSAVAAAEARTTGTFVQDVSINETLVKPGKVEASDVVKERILSGAYEAQTYTVERGDCLSLIAQKFAIPLETLRANNPEIKRDLIRVGQKLAITVKQPLLTVKTTELRTEQRKVPSGVVYEKDDSLRAGVIQIVSQGKPGLKKVTVQSIHVNGRFTEQSTVGEELLEAPVQTVVKQGTKVIAGAGSGKFAMPVLRGEVTSQFGLRWGKSHNGTDFVSEQRGIMASDSGKVVYAGWKSGYGNCIVIDHGNGYETLYGHLSKIEVKKDEFVTKGEKIGVMGSTGNSTGVHLHFEIIKNGSQQNPMKYLS